MNQIMKDIREVIAFKLIFYAFKILPTSNFKTVFTKFIVTEMKKLIKEE